MQTPFGTLTYCTNIHAGESWDDHFAALKENLPRVKERISPDHPYGIGLRLSNQASHQLQHEEALHDFKNWLAREACYVFTMNGFPYGGFHHTEVKDQVHAPDWTTADRVTYTQRLFTILSALLPAGMEGGISTSPLSYKYWYSPGQYREIFNTTTHHILQVVEQLVKISDTTGQVLHLDIEPEPDGLLESGPEFITWYEEYLIPAGIRYLQTKTGCNSDQAIQAIKRHVQLCYDVCHFAVGYEPHEKVIGLLREKAIRVGKIQISAALKALMPPETDKRVPCIQAFQQFNESTYLHQVVARQQDGSLKRYPDLPQALQEANDLSVKEWRSHFHVPLFVQHYGALESTQSDIKEVLAIQRSRPFTSHLEVETYTWEVLPGALKLPLSQSIIREMEWVLDFLTKAE